jgi:hypothetical protein
MNWSFTDKSNWTGPFFELMFELGPHPDSVAKARQALELLWLHPTLDGPYESHWIPLDRRAKVVIAHEAPAELPHVYGMATWPDGRRAPSGATPSCAIGLPIWLSMFSAACHSSSPQSARKGCGTWRGETRVMLRFPASLCCGPTQKAADCAG